MLRVFALALALLCTPASAQTLREQLFEAIVAGNDTEVVRLVKAGIHYTAVNKDGDSALIAAAEYGRTPLVKLLLENGADVNARNANGETALHLAALQEDEDIARLLLERGAAVDPVNRDGESPLMWAALTPSLPVLKLLLDAGARVSRADSKGNTALHAAAAHGHVLVALQLLAHKADRNARNKQRQRPVDLARERGEDELVDLLASRR